VGVPWCADARKGIVVSFDPQGYALGAGEGDNLWFFNSLATIKARSEETHGSFTLVEILCPADFGPPPHVHEAEDEGFYVLDGKLSVVCGDREWTASPGGFVFLPRGIIHHFRTGGDGVRMLQITTPAQFERFAAELGEPASELRLPEPRQPNVDAVVEVGRRYGIQFVLD
jgi:quercetin dioxygenase-like cupin family protein